MKRVLPLLAIVLSVFMLFGCAKRDMLCCTYLGTCETEKVAEVDGIGAEEAAAVAAAAAVATAEEAEVVAEEVEAVAEEAVEVAEVADEIFELPAEVKEAVDEAVWTKYMIQPNDYLMKIALEQYGVVSMWREIWDWNKEMIGDNPDIIYPYEELDLLKEGAVEKELSYEDYTVDKGESLWTIAKDLYGNSYAWVVILRDNMEVVGEDYNVLTPGTVLKVRTEL